MWSKIDRSGVYPEFVDASHWKLNLGGGDVLQSTTSKGASGGKDLNPLDFLPPKPGVKILFQGKGIIS